MRITKKNLTILMRNIKRVNDAMSGSNNKIKLFEEKHVRTVWDEEAEKWWFSVVDVIAVLIDGDYQRARKYWKVLKGRLSAEGNEMVTNCYQLKMILIHRGT